MTFLCAQFRANEILIIHKTQKSCGTKPVSLAQPSCRYDLALITSVCHSWQCLLLIGPTIAPTMTTQEAFNLRLHSRKELKSPLLLWRRTGYRFHKHSDLSKQSFLSKWGGIRPSELWSTQDHQGRREQQCLLLKTNRAFSPSRLTVSGFDRNADLRHGAMTPL